MTDEKPNLYAALAALQGELPHIDKSNVGDIPGKDGKRGYKYKYADLADVSQAILPLLSKHGLAFNSKPTMVDGEFGLLYKLVHKSGEKDEGFYPFGRGGSPQQVGSLITYARRYTLCAVTGAAPDEDDDAAAAEQPYRQSAGDVFENAAQARPRQGEQRGHASRPAAAAEVPQERPAQRMASVPADDPWYTAPATATTDEDWLGGALGRAASFTTPEEMRVLIAEGQEKHGKGEITDEDSAKVAEVIRARAGELKAAKTKPAATGQTVGELDPEDPWAAKVEEITSMEEAEAARTELLAAFKAGQVDTTRANRVQATIAARLAVLEGKVIEGAVAA